MPLAKGRILVTYREVLLSVIAVGLVLASAFTAVAGDKVLPIRSIEHPDEAPEGENTVCRRCLTPRPGDLLDFGLQREHRWSLPKQALAADFSSMRRLTTRTRPGAEI